MLHSDAKQLCTAPLLVLYVLHEALARHFLLALGSLRAPSDGSRNRTRTEPMPLKGGLSTTCVRMLRIERSLTKGTKGMAPLGLFVEDAQPAGPCRLSSCCPQDRHVAGWPCEPSKDTAAPEMLAWHMETDAALASLRSISTDSTESPHARSLREDQLVGQQLPGVWGGREGDGKPGQAGSC